MKLAPTDAPSMSFKDTELWVAQPELVPLRIAHGVRKAGIRECVVAKQARLVADSRRIRGSLDESGRDKLVLRAIDHRLNLRDHSIAARRGGEGIEVLSFGYVVPASAGISSGSGCEICASSSACFTPSFSASAVSSLTAALPLRLSAVVLVIEMLWVS